MNSNITKHINDSAKIDFSSIHELLINNSISPSYTSIDKSQITVAKPSLPPLNDFLPMLQEVWRSGIVTNNGPFHQRLEKELCSYLEVPNISVFSNGTLALLIAIKSLELKGEVITTPYSFVATSHVISWNGLTPVFCDIERDTLNICAKRIEPLITEKTSAILATNVYGMPCDFIGIQKIADKYNLKVIYDSAHAFGIKKDNKTILNEGDLSILSFHGTKVFTTFEGGAIICKNNKMKKKLDMYKNFAFETETSVVGQGINAKMNEFQAALGVLQLKHIDNWINIRSRLYRLYKNKLENINGVGLNIFPKNVKNNFSYFPIFIDKKEYGMSRDSLFEKLIENNILARRYFFPLISEFPLYKKQESSKKENLSIAHEISKKVICLPLHTHLTDADISEIANLIIKYSIK
tara:strand:+ start:480 stop:1706 length:1227 start_codon:yes stop_codon:yes gene_type:complete